eukprot:2307527-Pyramimonas_sp.AAC.1
MLLTPRHYRELDSLMARCGRRALQGKAVTTVRSTDADGVNVQRRIRSWSNRRVRQHWRLACAETEML